MTSSVQTLIAELAEHDIAAAFENTGGGCFVVKVGLPDGGELLISDVEGPLTNGDFDSDDERYGWSMGRYVLNPDDNTTYPEAEMVEGGRDDAYLTTDLADIAGLVAAVQAEIARPVTVVR